MSTLSAVGTPCRSGRCGRARGGSRRRRRRRSRRRESRMTLCAGIAPGLRTALSATAIVASLAANGISHIACAQQPSWSTEHRDESLRPELDAITARGRLLAEYDQASWHATDAVMALRPDVSAVRGYLARRRSDGLWEVVFGRLDGSRENFLI